MFFVLLLLFFAKKKVQSTRAFCYEIVFKVFFFTQQEDIFTLEAAELGNVFKVKLRHDNANFSPSWFVDRVDIRDVETDKLYPFVCERWLSKKKEEGKLQRTLYVKGYEV